MRILIVDDEEPAITRLKNIIGKLKPDAEIVSYRSVSAFKKNENGVFDVAFLDIEIGASSGLDFAFFIKESSPKCNIIFVTSYSRYAADAFKVYPSGYVMKPFSDEDIMREFENLRYIQEPKQLENDKIFIRTFGSFEVIGNDGEPVHFSRSISKEILAFLINANGLFVTTNEICAKVLRTILDIDSSKKLSQYIRDLIKDLSDAGYDDIVEKQWKKIRIKKENVDCDLYRMLDGDTSAINFFKNEYMVGYSWAKYSPYRNISNKV